MLSLASFGPAYRALVVGSSGAIGAAFVRALRADPACALVSEMARSANTRAMHALPFQLEDEASIQKAAEQLLPLGPYHLIIDATGALEIDNTGPERKLESLNAAFMARNFAVNTIGPALLLKNLAPLLAPADQRSVYGKLSARVGSIGDNKLGGWYSYRASKAAINQILHTAALELHRTRPRLAVAALQPGTVIGPLSKRFVGAEKKPGLLMPDESAHALLAVMDRIEAKKGAHFVDYEGTTIEW